MELELLTMEQMTEILGISEPTLLDMVRKNQIPHIYIRKRIVRFRKVAIIKWLSDLEGAA
ncbi:hypothetical protein AGMMS50255_2770 [Spirochaetia bacterium]|nr:hypothetical protein AGMMS50255_2770 [Spirochaetia bacterium]